MRKISQLSILFYASFTTFLGFLLMLVTLSQNEENGTFFELLWQQRVLFNLPLLISMISLSVIIGTILFLLVFFLERGHNKQVEKALTFVIRGEYEKAIDYEETAKNTFHTNKEIHQNIHLLAEKILQMSKKLQEVDLKHHGQNEATEETILKKERLRLSRELHDSVSQQLFAAMMILSGINEQIQLLDIDKKLLKQMDTVTDVINTAQSEMRALLLHLRPVELSGKSLKQGIEQLLYELQSKINIRLVWEIEEMQLAPNIEDHLFRMMQEILSNTLRHAKAEELEVYIKQINGNVQMRVLDDGVGFDMLEQKETSYGLKSLHERAESLGGRVQIISFKNQGTSVTIQVPIVL